MSVAAAPWAAQRTGTLSLSVPRFAQEGATRSTKIVRLAADELFVGERFNLTRFD